MFHDVIDNLNKFFVHRIIYHDFTFFIVHFLEGCVCFTGVSFDDFVLRLQFIY